MLLGAVTPSRCQQTVPRASGSTPHAHCVSKDEHAFLKNSQCFRSGPVGHRKACGLVRSAKEVQEPFVIE